MERLFTSITNAEESAERINNDLHTGYYAGEREDYMMNGINVNTKVYKSSKIIMYNFFNFQSGYDL